MIDLPPLPEPRRLPVYVVPEGVTNVSGWVYDVKSGKTSQFDADVKPGETVEIMPTLDYSAEDMRSYGEACARAALEAASKACDARAEMQAPVFDSTLEEIKWIDRRAADAACATAIRALKDTP